MIWRQRAGLGFGADELGLGFGADELGFGFGVDELGLRFGAGCRRMGRIEYGRGGGAR